MGIVLTERDNSIAELGTTKVAGSKVTEVVARRLEHLFDNLMTTALHPET
jgi:hypothetical protein